MIFMFCTFYIKISRGFLVVIQVFQVALCGNIVLIKNHIYITNLILFITSISSRCILVIKLFQISLNKFVWIHESHF